MTNLGIIILHWAHNFTTESHCEGWLPKDIQELPPLAASHEPPGGSKEKRASVTLIKSVGKREGVILIAKPTLDIIILLIPQPTKKGSLYTTPHKSLRHVVS